MKMDAEFWHERWRTNATGFHEQKPNRLLVEHFRNIFGERELRVFLPLCGKTRDIGWLLSKGYRIAGVELSETAVTQLFADLDLIPEVRQLGDLTRFAAAGMDIFVGDAFDLSAAALGPVDVIYDRAALVALPSKMRANYAAHLMQITRLAPQFLVTFEYDQSRMEGPPFSVAEEEIRRCYGRSYSLKRAASVEVAGGLKGSCPATENAWVLRAEVRK